MTFKQAFFSTLTGHLPCIWCTHQTLDSDEYPSREPHEPVLLNVYDMHNKINGYTGNIGLGIFHSGVEVYGREYGYGGHKFPVSGIFDMDPKDECSLGQCFNLHGRLRLKQSMLMGYTDYSAQEVNTIRVHLGRKFRGDKYHLIHHNCNHFSDSFIKILCKKNIPSWVNRLAYISSFIPFLDHCLPQEWVTPFY